MSLKASPRKVSLVFENLGEKDYGYGVKTITLGLNGRHIGYKAVFNKGKFVAIVGSQYKVLPNPLARKLIMRVLEEHGFEIAWEKEDLARLYIRAVRSDGFGVLFRNAIDGTSAFRIYITVPGKYYRTALIVARISAKHYDNAIEQTVANLQRWFTEEYMKVASEALRVFDQLEATRAEETLREYIETLEEALPKKYVAGAKYVARKHGNPRAVLEYVAKNIWYARVDDDYKITLFKRLLDATRLVYTFFAV